MALNKDRIKNNDWRSSAPIAIESKALAFGDYQSFDLPNGLKVILVENHKRPIVSLQLSLNHDDFLQGEEAGYVGVAGDLLNKGTKYRTKSEIDNSIDFIGARLTSNSNGVYANALKKHLNELLDIFTEVILEPSFPEEEFEKSKTQALSSLRMSVSNADAMISNVGNFIRYGKNHPYGEIQTIESTENIKLATCISYYEKYFRPNNAYLIIVGDITINEAKKHTNDYFGNWEKRDIPLNNYKTPNLPNNRKLIFIPKEGINQSVINITYPVILKPNSPDIIKSRVLNTILGGGVFSGRLMKNLREDKAYTYGARSSLVPDSLIGYFNAYANVGIEFTEDSVRQFIYELDRMITSDVTQHELDLVKNSLIGNFARSLESPQTLAVFARHTFKYKLPKNYYKDFITNINAVTIEDIRDMSNKYLKPENCYILVVGDQSKVANSLLKFDQNEEIVYYNAFAKRIDSKTFENKNSKEIINKYLTTIGGKEKLSNINSMQQIWKANINNVESIVSYSWLNNHKHAYSIDIEENTICSNKYDGSKLVMEYSDASEVKKEGIEFDYIMDDAIMFHQLNYIKDNFQGNISYDGLVKIDDNNYYKLVITKNNLVSIEYYSIESYLLFKRVLLSKGMNAPKSIITEFKQYTKVEDILIPHQLVITGVSEFTIVMSLDEIKFNMNLKESIFT